MPKRARSKSVAKKKYTKKAKTTKSNEFSLARPLSNKQTCNFRYADYGSISGGAGGAAGALVISANGLYDPNITGVGHQPGGFDQIMPLFDHYTVLSAKITVEFRSTNTDVGLTGLCGIALSDRTTAATDYRLYIESGQSKYKMLNEAPEWQSGTKLTHEVNIAKFTGRPNPLDEDSLRGDVASNPSEEVYFHIWAAALAASAYSSVTISYVVDYHAVFTEPRRLASLS